MANQKDGITWTDETWNVIGGCTRVSAGCFGCYAERMANRGSYPGGPYEGLLAKGPSGARWNGTIRVFEDRMAEPLRWRRPRMVFVNSMSDLFHENVAEKTIDRIVAIMLLARQHTFQVLTKRPERMRDYLVGLRERTEGRYLAPALLEHASMLFGRSENDALAVTCLEQSARMAGKDMWPLPNVWWGTSCEDQKTADERIPFLLETPAAVRWISAEPLLGPVDLSASVYRWLLPNGSPDNATKHLRPRLDWVVVGGESGPRARPMHPQWVRALRDQCVAAGVPFHLKQWGQWAPRYGERSYTEEMPLACVKLDGSMSWIVGDIADDAPSNWSRNYEETDHPVTRTTKAIAGRTLDGRQWNEFPTVSRPTG